MTRRPRWIFWARGTLLSSVCGHWVANLLLDPDQYERAGVVFTWRAFVPVLIQTLLVLLVVVALGPLSKRPCRVERRRTVWSWLQLLTALSTSQLLLFFAMETTERLVQQEPFTDGLFASGFAFELLFAIVSAFFLIAFGSAALRIIHSLGRRTPTRPLDDWIRAIATHRAPARTIVGVGGVRSPPFPAI